MIKIPFNKPEHLQDLLVNAPNKSILINTNLLQNRTPSSPLLFGMDFDGTITTLVDQLSSWQEVRNPERCILSPQGIQRTIDYYQKWKHDDSLQAQRAWGDDSIQIMHEDQVSEEKLTALGRSLRLRQGFLDLASLILSRSTTFAVVTWGLATIVEPSLSVTHIPFTNFQDLTSIPNGIVSYAERVEFSSEGVILPPRRVLDNSSVYGIPKITFMNDFKHRMGLPEADYVFIGDSTPDLLPNSTNIFIHHREQHNIPDTSILFEKAQYILIGGSLLPLINLCNSLERSQAINI